MIYRDIAPRGSGKSTRILKEALEKDCDIATVNTASVKAFWHIAEDMGIGPEHIRMENKHLFVRGTHIAPIEYWLKYGFIGNNGRSVLVDELSHCMNRIMLGCFAGYSDDNGDDERRTKNAER